MTHGGVGGGGVHCPLTLSSILTLPRTLFPSRLTLPSLSHTPSSLALHPFSHRFLPSQSLPFLPTFSVPLHSEFTSKPVHNYCRSCGFPIFFATIAFDVFMYSYVMSSLYLSTPGALLPGPAIPDSGTAWMYFQGPL